MGKFKPQDIVIQFLKQHPDIQNQTAARLLYRKHKGVWSSFDSCRHSVRYARGKGGKDHKKSAPDRRKIIKSEPQPEVIETKWKNQLPSPVDPGPSLDPVRCLTPGSWGIMSDVHLPFHHKQAVETCLSEFDKSYPTGIILLGDIVDCHALSRFDCDPRSRNFQQEITCAREFLSHLRERYKNCRILYKLGNHEARLQKYMMTDAWKMYDLDCLKFDELVSAQKLGIEMVDDQQLISLGRLTLIHGHEYKFTNTPVGPARGLYLKARCAAMCGHFHRTTEFNATTLNGQHEGCWSLGSLCNLKPKWRRINDWNHGFAIVTVANDGSFEVSNRQLDDEGKRYA